MAKKIGGNAAKGCACQDAGVAGIMAATSNAYSNYRSAAGPPRLHGPRTVLPGGDKEAKLNSGQTRHRPAA
jgi:hypothetical protein